MWVQRSIQKLIQPINLLTLRNVSPAVRCVARLKSSGEEKIEIPPPPKKPLISFFIFLRERRPDMQKKNPNLKMAEIVKLAAAEWSSLADKSKYIEQYQKEHELYKQQQQHWKNSLTAHQKEAFIASKLTRREKISKMRTKKQMHKLGKPKASRSALNFYIKERFEEKVEDKPTTNRLMQLCLDWKNIKDSEKEKYKAMAVEDKKRYEAEMKIWEKQMIKEGNADLVRRKTAASSEKSKSKEKIQHTKEK